MATLHVNAPHQRASTETFPERVPTSVHLLPQLHLSHRSSDLTMFDRPRWIYRLLPPCTCSSCFHFFHLYFGHIIDPGSSTRSAYFVRHTKIDILFTFTDCFLLGAWSFFPKFLTCTLEGQKAFLHDIHFLPFTNWQPGKYLQNTFDDVEPYFLWFYMKR